MPSQQFWGQEDDRKREQKKKRYMGYLDGYEGGDN